MNMSRAFSSVFAVIFAAGALMPLAGYAGEAAEETAPPAPLTEAELIAVIEGDLATAQDAERIAALARD